MTDDEREQGVELGGLRDDLESLEYPASLDDVLDEHGDERIDFGEESMTLEELIGPLEEDTYDSVDEVEEAIMSMVPDEAIGRKFYSDRTPPAPGEDRDSADMAEGEESSEADSF